MVNFISFINFIPLENFTDFSNPKSRFLNFMKFLNPICESCQVMMLRHPTTRVHYLGQWFIFVYLRKCCSLFFGTRLMCHCDSCSIVTMESFGSSTIAESPRKTTIHPPTGENGSAHYLFFEMIERKNKNGLIQSAISRPCTKPLL